MTKQHQLSKSELLEIREAFEVFDEEKTGLLTTHNVKVLIRALGFQVTREEVKRDVKALQQKRNVKEGADFQMVCEMMEERYQKRNPEEDILQAFQLFDVDDTGRITIQNLRSIASQLNQRHLTEDELRAMIDEFDFDQDGTINLDEFRFIMCRDAQER